MHRASLWAGVAGPAIRLDYPRTAQRESLGCALGLRAALLLALVLVIRNSAQPAPHCLAALPPGGEQRREVTDLVELPSLWYGLAYWPEQKSIVASTGVHGVVVDAADLPELQRGDVIEEIDQQPVTSVNEFNKVVAGLDPDSTHVFSMCRHRVRSFIVVRPR